MLEINKIYNADCLELMKQLPDKCVDLVLTDPPYGDGIGYGRNAKEILGNETPEINKLIMPDLFRILKDDSTCYIFSNWKFCDLVKKWAEAVGFTTKMLLVIVKNNIGMGFTFRNQYEVCWVFEKGNPEYNGQMSNVLKMQHVQHDKETHPHQKHINLIQSLLKISNCGIAGGVVLDCFSGSGTTAVACHNLKLNFICIEKDYDYWKASVERLENAQAQQKLF